MHYIAMKEQLLVLLTTSECIYHLKLISLELYLIIFIRKNKTNSLILYI